MLYRLVDSTGRIVFDDIFTKKQETFSGSEEQEYYFCRTVALNNYFNHQFPLIIDSFRDGEISSKKELIMLDCYKKTGKQIILTATLKDEEYSSSKYENYEDIVALDYSSNEDSKILQKSYVEEFISILKTFNIKI